MEKGSPSAKEEWPGGALVSGSQDCGFVRVGLAGFLSIPAIKLLFSTIESKISWIITMNAEVANYKTKVGIYEVFTVYVQ